MPAGDFSKSSIGTKVFVSVKGAYKEIYGLTNVQIQSTDVPTQTQSLLNGRSVQHTGTASPETLTAELLANYGTDVFEVLHDAKQNGTALSFRVETGPAEAVGTTLPATAMVAIDDAGVCTFSGTDNPTENDLANRQIAVGHVIKSGGKIYRIISISDANVVVVQDTATDDFPPTDVAAATYTVMNPQWTVTAPATVTQVGNFTADSGGNAATDSFSLAYRNPLPKWTIVA